MRILWLLLLCSLCQGEVIKSEPRIQYPPLRPAPPLPPLAKGEPPHYKAIRLPDKFIAKGLNNHGVVVGDYQPMKDQWNVQDRATVWKQGHLVFLAKSHPDWGDTGVAINDAGTVLGDFDWVGFTDVPHHAVLWSKNTPRSIPEPKGYDQSTSIAINNYGDILLNQTAFEWQYSSLDTHLWVNGRFFPNLRIWGKALNDRGQVVGIARYIDQERFVLWQEGEQRDLGVGTPMDINNRGQIVGSQPMFPPSVETEETVFTGSKRAAHRKPFLLQNGKLILLPVPNSVSGAIAKSINNRGQIVGYAFAVDHYRWDLDFSQYHLDALLWQNSKVYRLQNRTRNLNGWVLIDALRINDRGEILCTARIRRGKVIQEDTEGFFLLEPLTK